MINIFITLLCYSLLYITGESKDSKLNDTKGLSEVNSILNIYQNRTLKDAYSNYFPVGAAITPGEDLTNPQIANLLKTQFSSLTAKTAMQPFWIHPQENKYNWKDADAMVEFARVNNMKVRGHCLIYYRNKHMPSWFYRDRNKTASKSLLLQRIHEHINTVVSRYKGKVYCWDVINEAVSRKKNEFFWSDDSLYQIAGEDYIIKAFEYARQADPSAKLFYNDQFDRQEHAEKVAKYLKTLKDKGVPIDGIGIQCHLGINGISTRQLQSYIDMFSSIGLEVQITELDVSIYPRNVRTSDLLGLNDKYSSYIQQKQSSVYKAVFDVCRKNKEAVTGITFWGFADDYGPNSLTVRLKKKNYPFLFNNQFDPKDAFYKVVNF